VGIRLWVLPNIKILSERICQRLRTFAPE